MSIIEGTVRCCRNLQKKQIKRGFEQHFKKVNPIFAVATFTVLAIYSPEYFYFWQLFLMQISIRRNEERTNSSLQANEHTQ